MKLQATILALAFAANVKADDICLGDCNTVGGVETCTFKVNRDIYSSEWGYYTFEGEKPCEGTNPTLGIKKGVTYIFEQYDPNNWFHALGFAYEADGALGGAPELEPCLRGPGSSSNCEASCSCSAPMYRIDGDYLGDYSNNPAIAAVTTGQDNFGLDDYEPLFKYPLLDWIDIGEFSVSLLYNEDDDFEDDFFYICHIHAGMSGRIKFVDDAGNPLNDRNYPPLPDDGYYPYQVPDPYDEKCGTYGLEDFQLPNSQCPSSFVCGEYPSGAAGVFAGCIESMDCAMLQGMTTNYPADDPIALFAHQMIPHHQNAVNMCKALFKTGAADCSDLTAVPGSDDVGSPSANACTMNAICRDIINGQNKQIQDMIKVLNMISNQGPIDCVVEIGRTSINDDASLDDASVDDASVDDASVDDASVDDASVDDASVDDASMDDASMDDAYSSKSSYSGKSSKKKQKAGKGGKGVKKGKGTKKGYYSSDSSVDDASVDDASLDDASVDDASLDDASVDDASLDDASVDDASLDDASVDDASVDDASVDDASVDDASVDDASVDDASVDDASVDDASVDDASVDDASVDDASVDDASVDDVASADDASVDDVASADDASVDDVASVDDASVDDASVDDASVDDASVDDASVDDASVDDSPVSAPTGDDD